MMRTEVHVECDDCGRLLSEKYPAVTHGEALNELFREGWSIQPALLTEPHDRGPMVLCPDCQERGEVTMLHPDPRDVEAAQSRHPASRER